MKTATYLDTGHQAARPLSRARPLAGHVADAAAAVARSSLRVIAAAADLNRRRRAAAHLSALDDRLVRDLGFNHRGELLFAGRKPVAHSAVPGHAGSANDNGASGRVASA